MSSLPVDLGIWVLLFTGVIFSGFGLMGLMIFPDTKSRMFTAFRATGIGLAAVVLAVITYGYLMLTTTGGDQYSALIIHMLFLAFVLAAGTWVMHGIIRESIRKETPKIACEPQAASDPGTKDGE